MNLSKKFTDFLYGTERVKRKFSAEHPGEIIFAADASKGIITKSNHEITRGLDWVTSQRAVVILTNKRIKCGRWNIPLEQIISAQIVKFPTTYGAAQVLKIETKNQDNYQFGMQMNKEWTEQTVLPLALEKQKLKYSFFSIAVRVLLLGYLVYWVIEKFK